MISLFLAELKRRWSLARAYPFEEIAETLMMAVFFYMLFWGSKYMAGPTANFGTRLDAIVIAYILWLLIMQVFQGVAFDLQQEKTQGTLEQMMTSTFGAVRIFLARSVANLTITVVSTAVMGVIIVLLTGSHMHIAPLMVLPFMTTILAAIGLGFAFGSLVFVLKRVNTLMGVFQFFLLAIIAVPIESWGKLGIYLGSLIPLAPSSAAMRSVLVAQHPDALLMLLAGANGLLYFFGGIALFKRAERKARKSGAIGQF